ncbi:MAG: hypothetical protein ACPLRS_04320, partial [Hydrogenobacter sp.]
MIRPASFLRSTSLYILLFFSLLLLSLLLKLIDKTYIDLLVFFAFPGLISGTLFQLYPTIQGYPVRGEKLIHLHMLLWLVNILYFLYKYEVNPHMYLLLTAVHTILIIMNTRKIKDPIVLFFLMGSVFYLIAGLLLKQNSIFVKHLITVGFFMPVVIGSYYVFVPMLQIEALESKSIVWINIFFQFLSSLLVPIAWYLSNYMYVSYAGLLQLLSVGILSYGVYSMLSQRKSPLKGLDISVQFLILGLFMCWFFLLTGVLMAGSLNLGFVKLHSDGMLYGFLTAISVGASYHIMPFLLWWRLYAPKMGKEKIPTLKEIMDIKIVKRLLLCLPPLITGLTFGDVANPYLEKVFSLLLFLLLGLYTIKMV